MATVVRISRSSPEDDEYIDFQGKDSRVLTPVGERETLQEWAIRNGFKKAAYKCPATALVEAYRIAVAAGPKLDKRLLPPGQKLKTPRQAEAEIGSEAWLAKALETAPPLTVEQVIEIRRLLSWPRRK